MMARKLALLVLLVTPVIAWTQEPIPRYENIPQVNAPNMGEKLTQVTYSVADLVVPVQGLDYPLGAGNEENTKTKEEWLIQKVTGIVARNTWKDFGGSGTIQYVPREMALVVRQTPQVQAQVMDVLATMRRVQNVEVSMDTRVVMVSDEFFPQLRSLFPNLKKDGQMILSDPEVYALLAKAQDDRKMNSYQVPRLTLFPGQRARISIDDKLDVRLGAMVAGNLCHLDLDVKADVFKVRFDKAARLVEGNTLVLSAPKDRETYLLFLVTPRVIINERVVAVPPISRETSERSTNARVVQAGATVVAPNAASSGDGEPADTALSTAPPPRSACGDKERGAKQLLLKLGVYKGDPLGSREANTIRTLAEPTIMTLENQSFSLQAGGQFPVPVITGSSATNVQEVSLPYGIAIEGKPGSVKDGKLRLDLMVSESILGDRTADSVQVHTQSVRTNMTVKLGEVMKVRLGKGTADKQTWVELTVLEIQNTTRSSVGGYPGTLGADVGITFPVKNTSIDFSAPPFGGTRGR